MIWHRLWIRRTNGLVVGPVSKAGHEGCPVRLWRRTYLGIDGYRVVEMPINNKNRYREFSATIQNYISLPVDGRLITDFHGSEQLLFF